MNLKQKYVITPNYLLKLSLNENFEKKFLSLVN